MNCEPITKNQQMNFHIITIFPEMFGSYFNESILGRAQKEGKVKINIYDLRDYADKNDKRRTVDDTPCGGGPGMVMMVGPIFRCVENIKSEVKSQKLKVKNESEQGIASRAERSEARSEAFSERSKKVEDAKGDKKSKILILLTSAKGELYNQQKAESIKSDYTDVIIICGRYEGVDERVAEFIADEEVSIGKYVLTGGELPAMIIVDSVTRLLKDVLGNEESLVSESYNNLNNNGNKGDKGNREEKVSKGSEKNMRGRCNNFDYPVYTRPIEFNGWKVPEVLLGGNHKAINKWRRKA